MPANKKYLTENGWQRFAKLSSGLIGGYSVTALMHMNIFYLVDDKPKYLSIAVITIFLSWLALIIIPYLFKNGWFVWLIYLILISLFSISFYYISI